jgi:hypothetical protein
MKKSLLLLATTFFVGNIHAVELVCKGERPTMQNQRTVYVDCSNRKEVIDILGAAWMELRKQGIGGTMEDMCWQPYNRAKEMHPSISFDGIASTFFMQCNIALEYIK